MISPIEYNVECYICSNTSGYDKDSLKDSTWNINGTKIVLCCPCEDDLKKKLNKPQLKRINKWIKGNRHHLMMDDIEDIKSIANELEARYD